MSKVQIHFYEAVQSTQTIGSEEAKQDHLVSVLKFRAVVGGTEYPGLQVTIRQPFGTAHDEPIEVEKPVGQYAGPWHHLAFSELCETYYRKLIGAVGGVISVGPGAHVMLADNVFAMPFTGTFDASESDTFGAW